MRAWSGIVLVSRVLISSPLCAALSQAVAAPAAGIEQHSQGACSPPIANNSGQVTISCPGIDPEALRYLESQLTELFHKLSEPSDANRTIRGLNDLNDILRQQAADWEKRYREKSRQARALIGDPAGAVRPGSGHSGGPRRQAGR